MPTPGALGTAGVISAWPGRSARWIGREALRMAPPYVPDAGDIVWLSSDPQSGHEQAGHRPAVVISPASYNRAAGLLLCCPTTTRITSYPFEVALSGDPPSVALADQVKSFDWQTRGARKKAR